MEEFLRQKGFSLPSVTREIREKQQSASTASYLDHKEANNRIILALKKKLKEFLAQKEEGKQNLFKQSIYDEDADVSACNDTDDVDLDDVDLDDEEDGSQPSKKSKTTESAVDSNE